MVDERSEALERASDRAATLEEIVRKLADSERASIHLLEQALNAAEPGDASTERWGHGRLPGPGLSLWFGAFKTREAAIVDGTATYSGPFYVQRGALVELATLVPVADEILDLMGQAAYDIVRDAAEDFPDVSDEGKAELEALLLAWARKHVGQPEFWLSVGEPERVEVPR